MRAMSTTTQLPGEVDVCVIGGGPAGQTVAALLGRYRPGTRVLVLEREGFPRHRVGEGFIVDINRVLADMGAVERIEEEGFPRKWGTTFVWGERREPSTFLFREAAALVDAPEGYQLGYTWHVDRPRFDQLLSEVAVAHGAQFVTGQRVVDVLREGERVVGVRARGRGGDAEVRARWVIDCGGAGGPLTTTVGERVHDRAIRNIAIYGYFEDVGWTPELNGPPDDRRTLILTHPRGWLWLIPVSRELTSVGFVTSHAVWRAGEVADPVAHLDEVLRELPEYEALFAGARAVDYQGDGKLVHAVQELSYTCHRIWGPGWALSGDAAGFVDPVLSIGVYVAMAHAQFLAYALASVLDGELTPELALGSYARSVQDNCDAFRSVAHMFYAYNATRSDWWRECSGLLRQSVHVPEAAERQAFLAFVTGFSARHGLYEEAVNAFGNEFLVSMGQLLFEGQELFEEASLAAEERRVRELLAGDPRLRLRGRWELAPFALPATGTGRLRELRRLELEGGGEDGVYAIGRRLHVEPELAAVPGLLDGARKVSEVAAASGDAEGAERLILRLARMGALERYSSS